jgi:hypothetical protein
MEVEPRLRRIVGQTARAPNAVGVGPRSGHHKKRDRFTQLAYQARENQPTNALTAPK